MQEDFDLDAEPEEGTAAEEARILDAPDDAERLAELTANDTEKAEEAVSRMREELEAATAQPVDDSAASNELTAQLRELEQQAKKARRRAARIAAMAGTARQEARTLGALPQEDDGRNGDQE